MRGEGGEEGEGEGGEGGRGYVGKGKVDGKVVEEG